MTIGTPPLTSEWPVAFGTAGISLGGAGGRLSDSPNMKTIYLSDSGYKLCSKCPPACSGTQVNNFISSVNRCNCISVRQQMILQSHEFSVHLGCEFLSE